MQLSKQQVQDFIEAWREDFGETLSFESAKTEANHLLDFFAWITAELGDQKVLRDREVFTPGPMDEDDGLRKAWRKMMKRK